MIKLHIVIRHQVESSAPPARISMPWWGGVSFEKIKSISHAKYVGYRSGTVLLQSTSDDFVWIAPSQFALQKNNLLFI